MTDDFFKSHRIKLDFLQNKGRNDSVIIHMMPGNCWFRTKYSISQCVIQIKIDMDIYSAYSVTLVTKLYIKSQNFNLIMPIKLWIKLMEQLSLKLIQENIALIFFLLKLGT